MYNPGITTTIGSFAEAANSTIQLTFVDTDIYTGQAFCQMDITLPWGTLDQFIGGYVGDVITRTGTDRFYAIKILSINVSAGSATFQVLSYARGNPANVGVSNHNLPSIANPGSTINYDFELTNNSTTNVNIRWLFASKVVTTPTDTTYPNAASLEALPITTYKKLGCWYDDWAVGGGCANGQTIIGNGGTTHITGSFVVTANTGYYENIALRTFVYISNYWGTGKHEYVEVGGDGILHKIFASPTHLECVNGTCQRVIGSGTDTCTPEGSTAQCRHLECVSGTCTELLVPGTNTCNTIGSTTECLTTGSINCTTTPSGAQIWLDGINTGQITPYTLSNISAQMHNVTYKLIGYNDCGINVTVTAGGTINADCTLNSLTEEITDLEVYYKVPWIYPKLYVDGVLYLFKQDFDNTFADQGYPNYKVQTTVYNENTHIITVTIKKMYSLSNLNNNSNINTLVVPILVWQIILVISSILAAYGIYNVLLWGLEMIKAKNTSSGILPSNRTITVNVTQKNKTTGLCSTLQIDALVTYWDDQLIHHTVMIYANSGSGSFILPNEQTPTLKIEATGLVHKLTPENLKVPAKGDMTFDICFEGSGAPVQNITGGAADSNNTPISCGNYMAFYSDSGNLIGEGALQTNGTFATMKAIPDLNAYIIITPCDFETTHKVTKYNFITKSEPMNINILVKSCNEAKNILTVILQRKTTSGIYEHLLPDEVYITTQDGKSITLKRGTDYISGKDVLVEKDGLGKGTYTVKVVRSDSTITIDTLPITFDTDCFNLKQLIFEAAPITNTADITIKVIKSNDNTPIEGVYVYVDTDTVGYLGEILKTNNIGETPSIRGLSYSNHDFTLKRTGYKNITHTLTINTPNPGVIPLSMDSELQVGTIDTSIINLTSNPSGNLIPNNDVKFEGELKYLNTDGSIAGALGLASINITIKEGLTTVKQYTVITDQQLSLSPGKFRTPTWTLPKSLAKKDLDVIVEFSGSGNYKASSLTQVFHVTEACCLNLPLIGCVASQTTCNNIRTVAYIGGGLLIGYIGYKIFVKK